MARVRGLREDATSTDSVQVASGILTSQSCAHHQHVRSVRDDASCMLNRSDNLLAQPSNRQARSSCPTSSGGVARSASRMISPCQSSDVGTYVVFSVCCRGCERVIKGVHACLHPSRATHAPVRPLCCDSVGSRFAGYVRPHISQDGTGDALAPLTRTSCRLPSLRAPAMYSCGLIRLPIPSTPRSFCTSVKTARWKEIVVSIDDEAAIADSPKLRVAMAMPAHSEPQWAWWRK